MINKSGLTLENLYHILFLAVAFLMPWPMWIENIVVSLLIVVGILLFFNNRKEFIASKELVTNFLLVTSIFLLSVAWILFSDNQKEAFRLLEVRLSLLLLPLIVFLNPPIRKEKLIEICKAFVTGILLASFYCVVVGLIKFYQFYQAGYVNLNPITYDLLAPLKLSHVHMGMYLAFCILICIFIWFNRQNMPLLIRMGLIFIIFYSFIIMMLITSKMAIIAGVFLSITYLVLLFPLRKMVRPGIVVIISFLCLVYILKQKIPFIQNRISETIYLLGATTYENKQDYTSTRLIPIKSSIQIIKEHWILGLGTGDTQDALDAWYMTHGYSELKSYNSHSQYLNILLSFGIAGFFLFLFSIVSQLKTAYLQKNLLYLMFLLLVLICCSTENVFNNNKGIVFIAVFQSIFIYNKSTIHA